MLGKLSKSGLAFMLLSAGLFSGSVAAYGGAPPGFGYQGGPYGTPYGGRYYAQPYAYGQQRQVVPHRTWRRGYGWRPPYFGGPAPRPAVYQHSPVRRPSLPSMCR